MKSRARSPRTALLDFLPIWAALLVSFALVSSCASHSALRRHVVPDLFHSSHATVAAADR